MNICLFGGTFDPVHKGHVAIARAAADRFGLKRILFCPANHSPFKLKQQAASYAHRIAMIALATQADQRLLVSDLESPEMTGNSEPNFTIETVRRLRKQLGKSDHLFFLCGIDTFSGIAKWREPEALLSEADFIVAGRPSHPVSDIAAALPDSLRPSDTVLKASRQVDTDSLVLPGATIHILPDTAEAASSTAVRTALESNRSIARFLDPTVGGYIKRHHLYGRHEAADLRERAVIDLPKGKSPRRTPTKKRNRTRE